MSTSLGVELLPENNTEERNNATQPKLDWNRLKSKDIENYKIKTGIIMKDIAVDNHFKNCQSTKCTEHTQVIDDFYNAIVSALVTSTPVPKTRKVAPAQRAISGWNELVKDYHTAAKDAFLLWRDNGKPRQGALFQLMKGSRAKFKYELKKCKSQEEKRIDDKIATAILEKSPYDFWTQVKMKNKANTNLPNVVDGQKGLKQVCLMWENHFKTLLNSIKSQKWKSEIENRIKETRFTNQMKITVEEIETAIAELPKGKVTGADNISAEHLQYADPVLYSLLADCFTAMMIHGHIPENLMKSVIVPLVKDKSESLNDKNNYRPIALASQISKVLEKCLLNRMSVYLYTTDNQFGFKKAHGTEQCIYVLKELVNYYRTHGSNVVLCFLDASKAFDRIHHWTLYKKLLDRNVPVYIIRFLMFWYTNADFCVRWGAGDRVFLVVLK